MRKHLGRLSSVRLVVAVFVVAVAASFASPVSVRADDKTFDEHDVDPPLRQWKAIPSDLRGGEHQRRPLRPAMTRR